MVKTVDARAADIHTRSDPDSFQAFQNPDMLGSVCFFQRLP
jgi:hypothetical protein